MTLMEKQDLMTANPARFTYRATFGAEWCLLSVCLLLSSALLLHIPYQFESGISVEQM